MIWNPNAQVEQPSPATIQRVINHYHVHRHQQRRRRQVQHLAFIALCVLMLLIGFYVGLNLPTAWPR